MPNNILSIREVHDIVGMLGITNCESYSIKTILIRVDYLRTWQSIKSQLHMETENYPFSPS